MKKLTAVLIALAVALPVAAQTVDQKFNRQNCTTWTGGVGGATTSYGNCDPVIVKEVETKEVIKEVKVPVPAPVQKKKPRE